MASCAGELEHDPGSKGLDFVSCCVVRRLCCSPKQPVRLPMRSPVARPAAVAGRPAVAAAPAAKPGAKPAVPAVSGPKLVVLIGGPFRADNLTRWGHLLSEGGLKRLMKDGARAVGRYGQQNTYTGPGHALIATGSYGYLNGITQNKFWNRQAGRAESMLYDGNVKILGEKELSWKTTARAQPDWQHRSTSCASPAKTAKSCPCRSGARCDSAGGHTGHAYWFSDQSGEMTTSTFYTQDTAEWVKRWNSGKMADKLFGKVWDRLFPESAYTNIDASPHEADLKGLGRVSASDERQAASARTGLLRIDQLHADGS